MKTFLNMVKQQTNKNKPSEDASKSTSFKPFPGADVPLDVLPRNEARWVVRIYLLALLILMIAILFLGFRLPNKSFKVWSTISQALEKNFDRSEQQKDNEPNDASQIPHKNPLKKDLGSSLKGGSRLWDIGGQISSRPLVQVVQKVFCIRGMRDVLRAILGDFFRYFVDGMGRRILGVGGEGLGIRELKILGFDKYCALGYCMT